MQHCACAVKSDLHHDSPSAVCSVEGWRIERKIKRHWQYWLRQLPTTKPESLPASAQGAARWGWFRRISATQEAVLGSPPYRQSHQAFSGGSSASGTRLHCGGETNILLTLVFLYLSAKNGARGKLLKMGAVFPHIFYYPILSESSQYSKSRFRGEIS